MIDPYSYRIQTIGCQMNVYDSERMERLLQADGFTPAPANDEAGLIVINTCAIRAKAEQKLYSLLGRLAPLKKANPHLIVAVGGCVAQQEGGRLFSRAPQLDVVFGTHAVHRLPLLVDRARGTKGRIIDIETHPLQNDQGMTGPAPQPGGSPIVRFVTIMQGCDNYCTYCVVPYVRGREVSRTPGAIVAEIESAVAQGVRSVTLLGQNVNSYGGREGYLTFPELLETINALDGLEQIRFITSHPKDLSDDLIAAFGTPGKLAPHIHLPVQSGSDAILKRMNRRYTRKQYIKKVEALRTVCPEIAISSDFIVGFPGESDNDFEASLDLIETIGFSSLFAFPYSDRPNAPATTFEPKVAEKIKAVRLQKLLTVQKRATAQYHQQFVGKETEVLVEGQNRHPDRPGAMQWYGRNPQNLIVHIDADPGAADLTGKLKWVKIDRALHHCLKGTLETRPLQDICCCSRSRKAKNVPGGIY